MRIAIYLCAVLAAAAPVPPLPVNVQWALAKITPADLKGDLSFLASDTLQGRFTPSPGLETAAEFIASRFRAAGLQPGGDHEYFQVVTMVERRLPAAPSDLVLRSGGRTFRVSKGDITILNADKALNIDTASAVLLDRNHAGALPDVKAKVAIVLERNMGGVPDGERYAEYWALQKLSQELGAAGAVLEVRLRSHKTGPVSSKLLTKDALRTSIPEIGVPVGELGSLFEHPDKEAVTASFEVPAAIDQPVVGKNVIGILRGSDPTLAATCVLLTAHYDHVGTVATASQLAYPPKDPGDSIYNGANDDGSGTVSVLAVARALSSMPQHPKRSIVFMTFFGEERGELGSKYYGQHPIFPISKTIADINLEQVGRTDASNGPQLNNASITGFDYSDVTGFLRRAGARTGIKIYKDSEASDAYFTRSDNDALAEQGVPAHTLCVAFEYPDYHAVGDEWQKINYENMAKVDRAVALALLDLANSIQEPQWNAAKSETAPFRAAREKWQKH